MDKNSLTHTTRECNLSQGRQLFLIRLEKICIRNLQRLLDSNQSCGVRILELRSIQNDDRIFLIIILHKLLGIE